MNQAQLAEKIEKSQQFVSLLLKGERGISWETAKKIAGVLGKTPSFWMEANPDQLREVLEEK